MSDGDNISIEHLKLEIPRVKKAFLIRGETYLGEGEAELVVICESGRREVAIVTDELIEDKTCFWDFVERCLVEWN